MASLNKAQIIGHLGRDPEIRHTANGAAIANVSIATTSRWKDKATGEQKEDTQWHRCVFYDRLAEIAGEYLTKGAQVFIEGQLKTRKWQDKDGVERYTTEIHVRELVMLGSAQRDEGEPQQSRAASPSGSTGGTYGAAKGATQQPAQRRAAVGSLADMDDDIPF
jgi:single-strand DNA-binding protein